MGAELKKVDHKDMNELSSYQSCFPGKDGKFLHVLFAWYDDNKKNIKDRFYNPRYKSKENLGLKKNLYYVKVNLKTFEVQNFGNKKLKTPIDMDTANAHCMIWDTEWRGTGIPPDFMLDGNGNPAILHVLSEDTPNIFNYYYVRYVNNKWVNTVIAPASHHWNSCFITTGKNRVLYAYLITDDKKHPQFDPEFGKKSGKKLEKIRNKVGKMDYKGGGRKIEKWMSADKGYTWKKIKDLTPNAPEYDGWKFNNVQPIRDKNGNIQDGMLLFYGWNDPELHTAKAFLIVE